MLLPLEILTHIFQNLNPAFGVLRFRALETGLQRTFVRGQLFKHVAFICAGGISLVAY